MLDSLLGRRASATSSSANTRQIDHDELLELRGQVAAIEKSQAVIVFTLDGTIISANDNFLQAVGYTLAEVQGQHHRMFVDADYGRSPEYRQFWADLNAGKFSTGEYRRLAKGGREVWLQATYNPILDEQGKPFRVVKYASDITATKLNAADFEGQLAAISKSQAVIEFELDGTVRTANENFLKAMGYRLDEIRGKQHRIFVDAAEARSGAYATFWADLRSGEFQSGEFRRIGKGGREIWIQATYNPILDPSGRPFKVVKYAVDITARKKQEQEVLALAERVGTAATRLASVAEQMSERAGRTSDEAGTVSTASEQIAANVQTVASGSEEMTASIKEIAQSAAEAARVASQAVVTADEADQTIAKLGTSSVEIGQVVKTITAIAQQTNLLALNATIEAARAGEAGKGFAVVANEVKELAKATASATEDIGRRIGAIQHDSESAVAAIREVGAIISRISDIQTSIAGAVEEQTATTNEMSRNVSEAARGSAEIMHSIGSVAAGAQETVNSATETRAAADELVSIADAMRGVSLQHA